MYILIILHLKTPEHFLKSSIFSNKTIPNPSSSDNTHTHTHTHTHIYIYIYIYIFRQHFFVNANFIEHNRHFMPTNSLLDPFEFPYYFYRIRGELIKVLSIVVCILSTFCPTFCLMMAQRRAESTRDTYNYGQYLNQFPPNTIKVIREFERIQKKICRHKMSIMFNEICIYIYIYIYAVVSNSCTGIVFCL